eukprot:2135652-Prymnesium_polylepis.1
MFVVVAVVNLALLGMKVHLFLKAHALGRSVVVGLLLHEERVHPTLHAPQLSCKDRDTGQRSHWFSPVAKVGLPAAEPASPRA